jgi:hypothetical protein
MTRDGALSGETIYRCIARRLQFDEKWRPDDADLPTTDHMVETIGILICARFHLLEILHRWQLDRCQAKRQCRRFPITRPITGEEVYALLQSVR